MRVRASNLTMRFYKKDGWTEELLTACLAKPENTLKTWPTDENQYWIADSWNCFDLDKLALHVTEFETFERKLITDRAEIMLHLEDNN